MPSDPNTQRRTEVAHAALAPAEGASIEDAATRCRVLSRALGRRTFAGRAGFGTSALPGSPWRDDGCAAVLLWLHLVEHGPTERRGELVAAAERARDRRATSLVGRGVASAFADGTWRFEWLEPAIAAARASEKGGSFASRRDQLERAAAWSGGAARAVAARRVARPTALERLRARVGGPEAEGMRERALEHLERELVPRLEAGLVAERLARWTAAPARELEGGRLVVPIDELARAGLSAVDLAENPSDPRWAQVIADQVGVVRGHCAKAWPAVRALGAVHGRWAAAWLVGVERCLERIERAGFLTTARPVAGPRAAWSGLVRVAGPEDYRGLG